MIIIPHMLVGAAIGVYSKNIETAFLFGLASHYLLDFLPHWEYFTEAKVSKISDVLKILADFFIGLALVSLLLWDSPGKIIIAGAIFGSLLPDVLCFLSNMYDGFGSKILRVHFNFHYQLHYFKDLSFWPGLPAALIVIIASVFLIWG